MHLLLWLPLIWLAGWSALPFAQRIWKEALPDAGLAAGRVLLLALWALIAFWLGHAGVPIYLSALLIYPLIGIGLIWCWRERGSLQSTLLANRHGILISEVLFLSAFAFFLLLRGYWPDTADGEKPMDMALLSSLARAEYLPPLNPYAAAERLTSYYYFGHLQAALLCDAAFVPPRYGYNLMCATLPALIFPALFSLCAALTKRLRYGVFSALLVLCCGTLEPLRHWLPQIFGEPLDAQPYFATSRVIPHTINEYPFFTFGFADLHAHFFAMPISVLVMCLAFALWRHGVSTLRVALCGALLGALLMTNTWDFPIYTLLALIVIGGRRRGWLNGVLLIATALSLTFPYWSKLHTGATSLHLVWPLDMQTESWLLVWFLWLSLYIVARWRSEDTKERAFETRLALCGVLALLLSQIFWTGFLPPPFHRQDTVFKFGLQSWMLLGTAAACGACRTNFLTRWPISLRVLYFVLIPISLYSSALVVRGRAQKFRQWQGFDSWHYLAPPERAAVQWLFQNARDGDAILEAEQKTGGDYTEYSRYTHASGISSVIGPQAHSFQWVGNWDEVFKRKNAVRSFYTSSVPLPNLAHLREYSVRWIILGELERREYGADNIVRVEETLPVEARFGMPNDPHRVVICNNPLRP